MLIKSTTLKECAQNASSPSVLKSRRTSANTLNAVSTASLCAAPAIQTSKRRKEWLLNQKNGT